LSFDFVGSNPASPTKKARNWIVTSFFIM